AIAYHWYAHWHFGVDPEMVLLASRRAVELDPLDLMLNAHLLFMEAGALRQRTVARRHSQRAGDPARLPGRAHHARHAPCAKRPTRGGLRGARARRGALERHAARVGAARPRLRRG